MERRFYRMDLFDFYGALLTERQQEYLRLHLYEDFSLAEIGEELGISRQAVYDNIHRAEKSMEEYEAKLGLVDRYRRERAELQAVYQAIEGLRGTGCDAGIDEVLKRLLPFLGREREVSD